jgi:hypothetical protein
MAEFKYIIHLCRYHDGPRSNEFGRDDYEITAAGDEAIKKEVEKLVAEHPSRVEYVQICDNFNCCRWYAWLDFCSQGACKTGLPWEPGAANPVFAR